MSESIRKRVRDLVKHRGDHSELADRLDDIRRDFANATVLPRAVGDRMYGLIVERRFSRCLELGMATGSSAAYMLKALEELGRGELVSIDRAQTTMYKSLGLKTLDSLGLRARHRLVEKDSIEALFEMWQARKEFDFVFLDGWKTFDHMAVEVYLIFRMLPVGGIMMFDDVHMPSVKKIVHLLMGHYQMAPIPSSMVGSAAVERYAHAALALTRNGPTGAARVLRGPVAILEKTVGLDDLPLSHDWDFYSPF